jgi:hypothetical protein
VLGEERVEQAMSYAQDRSCALTCRMLIYTSPAASPAASAFRFPAPIQLMGDDTLFGSFSCFTLKDDDARSAGSGLAAAEGLESAQTCCCTAVGRLQVRTYFKLRWMLRECAHVLPPDKVHDLGHCAGLQGARCTYLHSSAVAMSTAAQDSWTCGMYTHPGNECCGPTACIFQ